MSTTTTIEAFITSHQVHRATGLPKAWLLREAEEGRLPSLLVGRRRFFRLTDVQTAIAARVEGQRTPEVSHVA